MTKDTSSITLLKKAMKQGNPVINPIFTREIARNLFVFNLFLLLVERDDFLSIEGQRIPNDGSQ